MNYIHMRYIVVMVIGLPLAMNGMVTKQLTVHKKTIGMQKMQKRLFFSENCDFYKLIADPQHSFVDVDDVIKREIASVDMPLCLGKVTRVQKKIVLEALKHMPAKITVLQPRFEGEKYDHKFNIYDPDAYYTYALAEFHRQVRGKICSCNRRKIHWHKSQAWDLAYLYNLDHMLDELNLFDERLERE